MIVLFLQSRSNNWCQVESSKSSSNASVMQTIGMLMGLHRECIQRRPDHEQEDGTKLDAFEPSRLAKIARRRFNVEFLNKPFPRIPWMHAGVLYGMLEKRVTPNEYLMSMSKLKVKMTMFAQRTNLQETRYSTHLEAPKKIAR